MAFANEWRSLQLLLLLADICCVSCLCNRAGCLQLLRNKAYLVLLLCMGSVIATYTCVSSLLEQILCVQGYDDVRTLC